MRVEKIGDCTLYHGDCMDIMPGLPRVDAVVTDPPYGIGASMDVCRHGHAKSAWDSEPIGEKHIKMMALAAEVQIIWGGNYFNLRPSRGFFIWDKCQPENFSLAMAEMAWFSRDCNAKIFRFRPQSIQKEHPTQKPVELMKWCVEQVRPKPSSILDPFMGSGTTGVACAKMGLKFIGIEREASYFDIACRRIEEAYKQPDMFVAAPIVKHEQPSFLN